MLSSNVTDLFTSIISVNTAGNQAFIFVFTVYDHFLFMGSRGSYSQSFDVWGLMCILTAMFLIYLYLFL